MAKTPLGSTMRLNSRATTLSSNRIRDDFSPPAVDPVHPPTNISESRISCGNAPQFSKLLVTNPVVVMMELTWNEELRSAAAAEYRFCKIRLGRIAAVAAKMVNR